MTNFKRRRVVVIGGGTGTYQVLVGLKKYPNLDISAIVTMADSGGSTGRLRQEFGMFPPGDIRRALLALSALPIQEKTLSRLFDFRFNKGKELRGHSVGNIFLAALTQITGSPEKAIAEAQKILAVSGQVLPVTLTNTHLGAVLSDNTKILGETNIDIRVEKPQVPIKQVFLKPKAKIFPQAKVAILGADLIILGPGDLYTSIVPNLLVDGVNEAIAKSRGRVVFIVNLMTKHGETDRFTASKFIDEIKHYLGRAASRLSVILLNKEYKNGQSISWYRKYKSEPVKDDLDSVSKIKVIRGDFVANRELRPHLIRHNPQKVAKTLVGLL